MFIWDEKHCIGVKEIDEQHREMFAICRRLELLVQVPRGVDILSDAVRILCDLREYITFHFYTEEKFMESIKYSRFEEHKNDHEAFKDQVLKINFNGISDYRDELQILINNLYSYLLNHVQIKDMEIKLELDRKTQF